MFLFPPIHNNNNDDMNANNKARETFSGGTFGATSNGFYSQPGGYTRLHPKVNLTPEPDMWYPSQSSYNKAEFGGTFNNPIPILQHEQAARSSGRVLRLPTENLDQKFWSGDMRQDGQVMYVKPDPTLTAGITAAGVFPEQLPGVRFVPYNQHDQLGFGRV